MSKVGEGGDFLIAFGSQTGQSEAIAKLIHTRTCQLGLKPRLSPLNAFQTEFILENEPLIIIVCSSTGDGEPPDNAIRFVRYIATYPDTPELLRNITFALLGLGDSNYSSFQYNPRRIEKHLLRLGAKKLIESGVADDQVGLELAVEPWLELLYKSLCDRFSIGEKQMDTADSALCTQFVESVNLTENNVAKESSLRKALKVVDCYWPIDEPCLIKGDDKLAAETNLRVPVAFEPFLRCQISSDKMANDHVKWQNGCALTGSIGKIFSASVTSFSWLTAQTIIKPKFEIQIEVEEDNESSLTNSKLCYEPGDAFYIIVSNQENEVNFILNRMGLLDVADRYVNIQLLENTKKRNAAVPPYIPAGCSLRYIFTNCLDIRRSPGRPLLRLFAECTSDIHEKRRLLELCSAQGVHDFTKYVRQAGLSLSDFLLNFPSCRPTPDRLFELLPRLLPRPYSVTHTKERWGRRLRFAVSLMNFLATDGRRYARSGLASEWLCSLKKGQKINIIFKEPSRFRLPPPLHQSNNIKHIPLLMICVGTGLAPFLSFLQKLDCAENKQANSVPRMLYYGCRSVQTDCIYRDEIQSYVASGILSHLVICESQAEIDEQRKYVQDALESDGKEVSEVITMEKSTSNESPMIFVCGSTNQMSTSILATLSHILIKYQGKSEHDAKAYLTELRKNDRYLEDLW